MSDIKIVSKEDFEQVLDGIKLKEQVIIPTFTRTVVMPNPAFITGVFVGMLDDLPVCHISSAGIYTDGSFQVSVGLFVYTKSQMNKLLRSYDDSVFHAVHAAIKRGNPLYTLPAELIAYNE